jgi:hypothetical protein
MIDIPPSLMQLDGEEIQRAAEGRRHNGRRAPETLHSGALRRTIGMTMIHAGRGVAGAHVNGA